MTILTIMSSTCMYISDNNKRMRRSFRNDKVLSLTQQSKLSFSEHPKQVEVTQEHSNDECHAIDNATIHWADKFSYPQFLQEMQGEIEHKEHSSMGLLQLQHGSNYCKCCI